LEMLDDAVVAMLRTKTPAERIAMASAAHRTAREMLAAQVHRMHPDWSDEQVRQEVARRLIRGTS